MIITEFDAVFSERTGVTVLLPVTEALDPQEDGKNLFHFRKDDAANRLTICDEAERAVLENVKPDILAEIGKRGSFLIYEIDQDDEIVRISHCEVAEA